MKNLFIDSNIFLNFYHFSDDDLEELRKLIPLVKGGGIRLYITRQVINEVKRNRDAKIADAYKQFQGGKFEFKIPQICKTYSEYPEIRVLLSELKRKKSDLDKKLNIDIENKTLKADEVVNELFEIGEVLETDSLINKAKERYRCGNPPGKNNSYGDAISWEALLSLTQEGEDIFFISDDKDYKSPLGKRKFNSFLLEEWKIEKKSHLFFYTQLSEFFREHLDDIKLKDEDEKNGAIEELAESYNFSMTHSIISRLSKFDFFSDSQIKRLAEIAITNSQVNWIATDPDVFGFYDNLLKGKEDIFEDNTLEQIKGVFNPFHSNQQEEPEQQTEEVASF